MAPLVELYRTDHAALVSWLFKTYGLAESTGLGNQHRIRRQNIADRLDLYRDQTLRVVGNAIDAIYDTQEMRDTLKKYIPMTSEQNVPRRIVNEIASLYDRPALRILKTSNVEFHAEEKRINLHFFHQEGHRLTNLCNETLLWQFKGINDKNTLRLITPNCFDAIPDPRDTLVAAGFLLDSAPISRPMPTDGAISLPAYELWDDTFHYLISARGGIVDENGISGSPRAHGLKRIPGVLFHRREPTTCILDSTHGDDIKSAGLGVALLNLMILRLSKVQGENQPVLQGNLAAMATGQVANGEKPLLLPPEVVASMLNMKTDPDHYLKVKKDKITSVAQTYGMSYEQFSMSEAPAPSGKVYQIRREKLTELRLEQRMRAVHHEALVVELMGFSSEDLRIDFQEQAMPTDAVEELSLLADKMKLGLDSMVSYMMRKDPDLDRAAAIALIRSNLTDYAGLIQWVRALNMPTGANAANPGQDAIDNGETSGEGKGGGNLTNAHGAVMAVLSGLAGAANNGNGGNGSNGKVVGPSNSPVFGGVNNDGL